MNRRISISLEARELIKAWAAISLAFGILIHGGITGQGLSLVSSFAIASLTVGLGFIAHELSHRYFARKFGKHAEFRANNTMLLLAIIMSFFGFIIAAPGAVMISGFVNKKQSGIISSAGPAANLVLAIIFTPLIFVIPVIAFYGLMINAWLAAFNLIPFRGFDGRKVLDWSKPAYFVLLGIALALILAHSILPNIMSI